MNHTYPELHNANALLVLHQILLSKFVYRKIKTQAGHELSFYPLIKIATKQSLPEGAVANLINVATPARHLHKLNNNVKVKASKG